MSATQPTLIYFPARGRAELIRLVLAEAGVDYHEHPVGKGTPPAGGRPTDLAALEESGAAPFGAVPVWEEPDGFRLAQSGAIAVHLARTRGLHGRNEREAARCDELLGAFDDVRAEIRKAFVATPEARPAVRSELATKILPRWFGRLDRKLRENRAGEGFYAGDTMSIADLALYYLVEIARDNGMGAALEPYPALLAHAARISARPRIATYLTSPRRPPFVPIPA